MGIRPVRGLKAKNPEFEPKRDSVGGAIGFSAL
jgi:hypothetical protein